MNAHKHLVGTLPLPDLLRADPDLRLGEVASIAQSVRPTADLEEVARLMNDYDLTVLAVVDENERMVGVVTVDDVLELVLPKGWRRRFGLLGDG
jgi:Mg/Co/Ni transporter MgtE